MTIKNSENMHMLPKELKDDMPEQLRQIAIRISELREQPNENYSGGAEAKEKEIRRLNGVAANIENFIGSH